MSGARHSTLHPARVGCSGWNYKSWRGQLYPQDLPASRWLEHYATLFDTVEVNTTFYRLIGRDAVARWVTQTPEGFLFAVKASRYLTHVKRLRGIADGVATFYERLEPLVEADRLGPVLWQLPESFHRDDDRLASALEELPPGHHALELRHPSWFVPEVYDVLREHGVALVIGDHPERPFQSYEATTPWRYVRMHYGSRGRRGNYSSRELEAWARRIHGWRAEGCVYVYFNNDWETFAPRNALELLRRLRQLAGERAAPL
ncbi:MAG TPA: DUF72 domain-containing protein [Solirubrobacteraceae bacterium]|jgi:uncharacterized protein YecE (DUF72 family)|nr:DUF72 domain-containing protein [Solirubrobacteraceae bacterium]